MAILRCVDQASGSFAKAVSWENTPIVSRVAGRLETQEEDVSFAIISTVTKTEGRLVAKLVTDSLDEHGRPLKERNPALGYRKAEERQARHSGPDFAEYPASNKEFFPEEV